MRLDPIVIRAYDPSWATAFERQRDRITPLLAGWITRDIEHMGSTSVPGLPAKAIVDMLAVVSDVDAAPRAPAHLLEPVDWVHAPEPFDEAERKLSYCFPDVAHRSHHLHVVEEQSVDWRGWLAFRDYLRRHADAAAEYAALKTGLADAHGHDPNDRDAYRLGKADFIRTVTDTARRDGLPRLDRD